MIFLTINKGGQEKHTGIKGGHSISHTTSLELSNPSFLISNEQSLKSDYLNQEMEKMDQTSSFLPFSRDITQIQIDIIINVSFKYRNVKFYPTREIKFHSEYVHQKPHAKQPKLSKAERFLMICFSLHSSCLTLPVLL